MLTDGDIARIVSRITQDYAPLAVGVFGSYATKAAREKSDLDLVVIKPSVQRPAARRREVQRLLQGVLYPLDVHVFTPEEFAETVTQEHSFAWNIARQARFYYLSGSTGFPLESLLQRTAP